MVFLALTVGCLGRIPNDHGRPDMASAPLGDTVTTSPDMMSPSVEDMALSLDLTSPPTGDFWFYLANTDSGGTTSVSRYQASTTMVSTVAANTGIIIDGAGSYATCDP